MTDANSEPPRCSFCGKSQDRVRFLIQSRRDEQVLICEECIDVCNDIVAEKCEQDAPPLNLPRWSLSHDALFVDCQLRRVNASGSRIVGCCASRAPMWFASP